MNRTPPSRPLFEPLESRAYAATDIGNVAVNVMRISPPDRAVSIGKSEFDRMSTIARKAFPDAEVIMVSQGPNGSNVMRISSPDRAVSIGRSEFNRMSTIAREAFPGAEVIMVSQGPNGSLVFTAMGADGNTLNGQVVFGSDGNVQPSAPSEPPTTDAALPAPQNAKPWTPAPGTIAKWSQTTARQQAAADDSGASLAFFGDSHLERYPYYGARWWKSNFSDALNLGLSGDGTRQMLQRISDGLFDNFTPKRLVLMLGTNNINDFDTGGTNEEIAKGIGKVIEALRERLPTTKIVLVSILPRRHTPHNERIEAINALISKLITKRTFFLDVYHHFKGSPVREDLYLPSDNHLNAKGYRLLTSRLREVLDPIT